VTNRLDPAALDLGGDGDPPRKSDYETKGYLIRHPIWLRNIVKDAAKREGLSANQWIVRVIAEAAKRSVKFGWRSIPIDDEPRAHPEMMKIEKTPGFKPGTATVTLGGQTYPITGEIKWTNAEPGKVTNLEPLVLHHLPDPSPIKVEDHMIVKRSGIAQAFGMPDGTEVVTHSEFTIPDGDIPDLS
jgi:hypothetical protein